MRDLILGVGGCFNSAARCTTLQFFRRRCQRGEKNLALASPNYHNVIVRLIDRMAAGG